MVAQTRVVQAELEETRRLRDILHIRVNKT